MNMENNKKKKTGNWFLIILYLVIGAVIGFLGGRSMGSHIVENGNKDEGFIMIILFLLFLYLAAYIHIIIHEAGHLFFGRLSGYQFVSFRIGSFMLVTEHGKLKMKRFKLKGTGGQCLMKPPKQEKDFNYPYTLYNLGGVLINLIVSLICILISIFAPLPYYANLFLILMFIMGIFFVIINGIPMRVGGIANDGYNLKSITKDMESRRSFWIILEINALLAEGQRLRDISSEWFEFDQNQDLANTIKCSVGVLRCGYLQDLRMFDQAKELSESLINNASGILELQKNELRCELMFFEIIDLCREEEIDKIYTKDLKKYIKITSSFISRRRLLYAYELLVNKNFAEAEKQLQAFEKISKTYPYKSEIESERELLELIKEKADSRRNL